MDYIIKDLYEITMSKLFADYGKPIRKTGVYSHLYNVQIERTQNFTILWYGKDLMIMLDVYDWNTHIALDVSADADLVDADIFVNGEIKHIIENFFWFADEVFSVLKDVLSCHE